MPIPDVVCAVGVSYKNLPVQVRELFSVDADHLHAAYSERAIGSHDIRFPFFALSTCNRTEVYGYENDLPVLAQLLAGSDAGKEDLFARHGYVLRGGQAIRHLHRVCAGLESQVPGDYEIVGQVRSAWRLANAAGMTDPVLERLVDSSIRASRRIRQETRFSSGTTSVAHVAAKTVLARCDADPSAKVLIYGAGKMGRSVLRGLLEHLPADRLCVLNRSEQTVREYLGDLDIRWRTEAALSEELTQAAVLVVATAAESYTVRPEHFSAENGPDLLIDLSVPRNIDPALAIEGRQLLNVDELSSPIRHAMEQRLAEVPAVEAIIDECVADFERWNEARTLTPLVMALRHTFQDLQARELRTFSKHQPDADPEALKRFSDRLIEKFSRRFMHRLKTMPTDPQTSHELLSAMLDVDLQ